VTPEELAAIKARAEAASPGPWRFTDYEGEPYIAGPGVPTDNYVCDFGWHYDGDVPPGNPAFIAAARTDVPALVAEVERLREALRTIGEDIVSDTDDWMIQHIGDLVDGALAECAECGG
jgi:hypothetical protein